MFLIDAEPGQHVGDFAKELAKLATRFNETLAGRFNDRILEAKPGMTDQEILKQWDDNQRRSYLSQ